MGQDFRGRNRSAREDSVTDQLRDVARSLGIEMSRHHQALNDARTASSVFQRLAAHVDENGLVACTAPKLASAAIHANCCARAGQPELRPNLNFTGLVAAKPTEQIDDDDPALAEYLTHSQYAETVSLSYGWEDLGVPSVDRTWFPPAIFSTFECVCLQFIQPYTLLPACNQRCVNAVFQHVGRQRHASREALRARR